MAPAHSSIRGILLDVGGPVLDETGDFARTDTVLSELLHAEGVAVTPESFAEARRHAIASFAPSYNSATIWWFVKPDVARFRRVRRRLTAALRAMRRAPTLQTGIAEVIDKLAASHRVGLVGNQPAEVRAALREHGVLDRCHAVLLSDESGVSKPDTRFFLAALKALGVGAHECAMVGDRLDNDVYPANVLNMRTVRVLTGPFATQEARTPRDLPDASIEQMAELPEAIRRLSDGR